MLVLIGTAKGALIMGTTQGYLKENAICLAGRPDTCPFIMHTFIFMNQIHYFSFLFYNSHVYIIYSGEKSNFGFLRTFVDTVKFFRYNYFNLMVRIEMGKIKLPEKAKLFFAIMYADDGIYKSALRDLNKEFGENDEESKPFEFNMTQYYEGEMGKGLLKRFVTAKELIDKERLAEIKILTNSIEDRYAGENRSRTINIDPGYITHSKLVLATTKNYSHRIYLRDGIFAEVTFNFRKNSIEFNQWTYPDYKLPAATEFFVEVHRKYMEVLKGN